MRISPSEELHAEIIEPFGVRISGALDQTLPTPDQDWLRKLLDEHGLIISKGQNLSLEQQLALMKSFGPVLRSDQDLAYVDAAEGTLNSEPLAYHSDMAFTRTPYTAISLHAVDVYAGESCTKFANGSLAYRRLTEAQHHLLDGLSAVWISSQANRRIPHDADDKFKHIRAPVMVHPRTHRPILYVNEAQTTRFCNMAMEDSITLLDGLFDVLYDPEFIYQHDWNNGDIAIWDNLTLQHGRPPLGSVTRRRLQRASVANEGLFDMHPDFSITQT